MLLTRGATRIPCPVPAYRKNYLVPSHQTPFFLSLAESESCIGRDLKKNSPTNDAYGESYQADVPKILGQTHSDVALTMLSADAVTTSRGKGDQIKPRLKDAQPRQEEIVLNRDLIDPFGISIALPEKAWSSDQPIGEHSPPMSAREYYSTLLSLLQPHFGLRHT
jgi:hypothetical protein